MLYCNRTIGSLIFAMLTTTSAIAAQQPKDASSFTRSQNEAVLEQLPFADRQDFEDAKRGFIGTVPDLVIEGAPGRPAIWDLATYKFLDKEKAPDTVNPSLWRIAQLNLLNGLFKVTDRVYQVRGFDMSNMTIIEGDTGLILIDPLISQETAAKALELYLQHRPKKPVVAVIYTHSHIDHYGGVKGVINEEDVIAGKVKVIAPEGFLKEAASENVYAGTAMARRALYQYGAFLPKGERGQVDAGLGKSGSLGSSTLIAPTVSIKQSGEKLSVDGVDMEFQMAPGTEAPSEFLIWFPQFKMLNTAEDVTHTLHNLYTLRGAQVRDAMSWWKAINTAIHTYGVHADVMVAQHHWPTWGSDRIVEHMANQRDMLKYIHDQTLNMANKGETMVEIAEDLKLPDSIGKKWYNRGYYGSVSHNAKAVYQRYLGWYDSNPAHLYNLPPTESAKRYVEFMGGSAAVIEKAKAYFDKGDYRWVAEVMDRVVFAEPSNQDARNLGADALEQLGYQMEDPTWRNEFLMGALELRNGVPKLPMPSVVTPDTVKAMSAEMLLDYMGIRLNASKAQGKTTTLNWVVDGSDERYQIELRNSVIIYAADIQSGKPDATITASKEDFANLVLGSTTLDKEKDVKVEGASAKVTELFSVLDDFQGMFPIVEP